MFGGQCQQVIKLFDMKFNVKQLIDDCGGVANLSKTIGVSRITPYRWIQQDMITTTKLSEIKKHFTLDVDLYFEEDKNGNGKPGA